jgi:hypothetical protein
MSDNRITTVNITILSSLAREVFPDVIPLSTDAHSSLLLGMFRAAASNWRQHKHSIGTQRVILNLICDIAIPHRGLWSTHRFPRYMIDELLALVENIVV